MAPRGGRLLIAAAALLFGISGAAAEDAQVNTIKEVFQHLRSCWKPPPPAKARPLDITVVVSFNRSGNILGHPRITYESAEASDNDRLQYRIAVMEALQRCTPMPFTDAMAGAAAGRPFAIQFRNRKSSPDKTSPPTQERRA
ncbi:hypothetical protein KUL72_18590 [Bradyrhizobium arachidis]|uniref:hypothetical protein n=1 Tax=Bradyrhizobium TaxID=374 RepID=UPI00188AD40D|nr:MULTISPECIES: hypothetical protein [Bradyrhizobium]MDN4981985.1 hypothetical protein [Bradyrhizobium sp. WYCCWR 13022]QOZ53149.1 hypothetical protein XH90_18560 [Bradyrhizobium sp. CCBAU 53338]UVO40228.1 hypothetical protein KUL72_18590 [Bradyrhizobium arachidis]